MRKHQTSRSHAITCFLLFCVVLYFACRKSEQTVPVTGNGNKETSEKFFESPKNADPVIIGIVNALNRENEKFPFAEAMVKNAGYPQWEFAVKKSRASSRGESEEQDINIPLVKNGEMKTTAILAVTINSTDTSYELFYPQYYTRYAMGDDTTNGNLRKAQDFFSVFAGFDYALFGITQYRVNDGRIFGFEKSDTLDVTVIYPDDSTGRRSTPSTSTDAADFITYCKTTIACVYANARNLNSRVNGNCVTTTSCTSIWIGATGGGGGSSTAPPVSTSGGSSGTTSGGTSGTGPLTTTACTRTMNSGNRELGGSLCGDPWTSSTYDVDCNTFIYTQDRTANWQEAGVNQIKLSWKWLGGNNDHISREITINHIVFGIPIVYNTGTVLSPGAAANITARILQNVKVRTYLEFDKSPYYPTDEEVTKYFKAKLQTEMAAVGGTAGATGSGNPRIIFKNEERSNWTNPYDCE